MEVLRKTIDLILNLTLVSAAMTNAAIIVTALTDARFVIAAYNAATIYFGVK